MYIAEQKRHKPIMKNKISPQKNQQATLFKYFTISASLFILGLGTIIYVNLLLPPSSEQEALALTGLVLSIPSGILAFYCYIRLLIERIHNFMER